MNRREVSKAQENEIENQFKTKQKNRDNHFVDPKTTENYTRRKSTQAKIRIKKYSKKKKRKTTTIQTYIHGKQQKRQKTQKHTYFEPTSATSNVKKVSKEALIFGP